MLFLEPCYNDLKLNADWNKWEYSDIEIVQMIRMDDMYPSPFLNGKTPAVRGAESKNKDIYFNDLVNIILNKHGQN